jgi:hypothetical protein
MQPLPGMPVIGVELRGKVLYDKDGNVVGKILEQLHPLGACDQHNDCWGPVVRFKWESNGKVRRECLYTLAKGQGYTLNKPADK